MIEYMCKIHENQGLRFERSYTIPKKQNAMKMVRHFNYRQKKNRILIKFGTKKVYNTDQSSSPSKFC